MGSHARRTLSNASTFTVSAVSAMVVLAWGGALGWDG
jgi:hypothetical protein